MERAVKTESFKTASEKAYKIISEKILRGEFKPGMKLSRRKMAELTRVSVIPVIEALNRLEEDGIVESRPQWGSFVLIPTKEKIQGMYYFREAIECQVARILAKEIKPEQLDYLYKMAYKIDVQEYNSGTNLELTYLHLEFHSKMAEFTQCKSLVDALKRVNLFWILCKAIIHRREKSLVPEDWHARLVDSFKEGDPDKVEKLIRLHIYDSLEPILEATEEYWDNGSESGENKF